MKLDSFRVFVAVTFPLCAAAVPASAQAPRPLSSGLAFDSSLAPGSVHRFSLRLGKGESANVVVRQIGVDVVLEVRAPDGSLFTTVDSPNGRNGDEPVEIIAPASGAYVLLVRPYDADEPAGRYRLEVAALRNTRATARLLDARRLARDSAAAWFRPRSSALAATGVVQDGAIPPLDEIAGRVRVLGLGEATHGSREFGDFRLSATKRLIQRGNYRIVAIEASESRLALLDRFVGGEAVPSAEVTQAIEFGWIGRRTQRELVGWLREWNAGRQPADRVRLVGLDPQDNRTAREALGKFLETAYGAGVLPLWSTVAREMAAADSQAWVFGNSDVAPAVRQGLLEIVAMLELDGPLLRGRHGAAAVDAAATAARQLAQMADFNSDGRAAITHWRDWYMAANLLRALERAPSSTKAVYWGHNAHVSNPPGRPIERRTAGAYLRDVLGCGYGGLALTFGEGAFVAQIPNDLEDRLAVSTLPPSPEESIDGVLGKLHPEGAIVSWACPVDSLSTPQWLGQQRAMHWVGGLYAPDTPPSDAFRPYDLLRDFDGVVYFRRVTADEAPRDRPLIPARPRAPDA
jgi:erythromycin esterase